MDPDGPDEGFIAGIINGLKDFITSLFSGLIDGAITFFNKASDFFVSIIDFVKNLPENIWNFIKELPKMIWDLVKGSIDLIITSIYTIVEFISNLFKNLLEFLKFVFVPADDYFTNHFTDIENMISQKLNLDLTEIENLKNVTEVNPVVEPIKFTIMGVAVSLDFTFIVKIRDMTQTIAGGLVAIFLCWFHYKKLVWLIRGEAPTEGSGK